MHKALIGVLRNLLSSQASLQKQKETRNKLHYLPDLELRIVCLKDNIFLLWIQPNMLFEANEVFLLCDL